jgi:hypothetical protein
MQGAARGLQEELGISVGKDVIQGPLAPTHKRELHQGDFHDAELVQSFRQAIKHHGCGSIVLGHGHVLSREPSLAWQCGHEEAGPCMDEKTAWVAHLPRLPACLNLPLAVVLQPTSLPYPVQA